MDMERWRDRERYGGERGGEREREMKSTRRIVDFFFLSICLLISDQNKKTVQYISLL